MSHRREQLAATLQRVLGQLICEGLNDPRIGGMISVTGVEISPDEHFATVGISVLPPEREKLTLEGLQSASRRLRSEAGKKLRRRVVPMLKFEADHSLKKEAQVLDAIRRAMEDVRDPQTPDESGDPPS